MYAANGGRRKDEAQEAWAPYYIAPGRSKREVLCLRRNKEILEKQQRNREQEDCVGRNGFTAASASMAPARPFTAHANAECILIVNAFGVRYLIVNAFVVNTFVLDTFVVNTFVIGELVVNAFVAKRG
ncbi:Hypothetical predicted protein [Lecanosticta acicola]|uniref:Uncharacterized protein n=1 Tax=Lecanosticta acicola TaxID=111012 RepID=A0AAI8Z9M7_9PEZI|nr:Hypothetical predicted protein [Lecanosticta acicola]